MVLELAAWMWFLVWGLMLSLKDLHTRRLPNRWVALAFAGAMVLIGAMAWQTGNPIWTPLAASLCVVLGLLAVHVFGGMGMGDVKYGCVIGLYLGVVAWASSGWVVWWGVWSAFLLATPFALMRMRSRNNSLAFGPFLTAGVWATAITTWAVQG